MSKTASKDPFSKAHLRDAEERVSAMASDAKERLEETYDDARARLDEGIAAGRAEAERLTGHSVKFVRDNPGLAVAGAVGAGLLLGLALSKPR
ncbi:hypothetical protein [Antarctobacter jejuensis]|uniref:hypothetical protein n=1 Tax=Antarctobacter jejuensis TaxID=1439938 RepID=UPI003FD56AEE